MSPYKPPDFIQVPDDDPLVVVRRDLSGGINSKMHGTNINDNQATNLINVDIGVAGQRSKRPGSVMIGNSLGDSVIGLHNFIIQGDTDQLLGYAGITLRRWTGSGNWVTVKSDFSASTTVGFCNAKESGLAPDDVVLVGNRVDNVFRIDSAGSAQDLGNLYTSPPKTDVMGWYGNRVWCLKDDLLYFSDAYPADYSLAFDRVSNSFRIPVGNERALVPTRDSGIVVIGSNAIWSLMPSAIPVATDTPQPLLANIGVVANKGVVSVGDDIYFFADDGLRSLKRTIQDKLQTGNSFPISYCLKDEFERINWAYKEKIAMAYFDNKIFISVPTGVSTVDIWVYYPVLNGFTVIQGWQTRSWSTYQINGKVQLYYGQL